MINLVRAEFYKLGKSLSLKICFLLSCISAAALVYISHGMAVGDLSTDISGSASGLTEIVIVSLLGSLMLGILICSDFETKTIHDTVACGNGRSAIILSKTLIYVFVMILLLLPYMAATIIGFCTGLKFSAPFVASVFIQILSDGADREVTAAAVTRIIILSLVTILVHAARLSVCIPLAYRIRKPVAILAIGFVFNAVIDLVIGLFKDVPLLKDIISFTPFARNFLLLSIDTASGTLVKAVVCCIIFIGLMAVLTYTTFRKAEIK